MNTNKQPINNLLTPIIPKVKMAYYEDATRKKDDAHSKWKTADAKVRWGGGNEY